VKEQKTRIAPDLLEMLMGEIEAQIDTWFVQTMHESQVSRATEIFNHVRVSVGALKLRLAALLQEF
jgi:hypothetical protein